MRILLSNDDGVNAPGLLALHQALSPAHEVVVMAPDTERSGASSAITLDRALRPRQLANGFWSVNGFPADCVYLATNGFFEQPFDLVVSGINAGANLGDDILYSGTVGAAFEGRLLTAALAVSLAGEQVAHYQHASQYAAAAQWVAQFIAQGIPPLPPRHIFNINVPDVTDIRGMRYTRAGLRGPGKPVEALHDPRGRAHYWIGLSGEMLLEQDHQQPYDTDFAVVQAGMVSVTPVQMDATSYAALAALQEQMT